MNLRDLARRNLELPPSEVSEINLRVTKSNGTEYLERVALGGQAQRLCLQCQGMRVTLAALLATYARATLSRKALPNARAPVLPGQRLTEPSDRLVLHSRQHHDFLAPQYRRPPLWLVRRSTVRQDRGGASTGQSTDESGRRELPYTLKFLLCILAASPEGSCAILRYRPVPETLDPVKRDRADFLALVPVCRPVPGASPTKPRKVCCMGFRSGNRSKTIYTIVRSGT